MFGQSFGALDNEYKGIPILLETKIKYRYSSTFLYKKKYLATKETIA